MKKATLLSLLLATLMLLSVLSSCDSLINNNPFKLDAPTDLENDDQNEDPTDADHGQSTDSTGTDNEAANPESESTKSDDGASTTPVDPTKVCLNITYTDNNGESHTGDIIVELDPKAAPITVANFQKLVREGFYDGLVFHRVIENFMIQGGGFDESLVNKEAASIKGEFSANGVNNPLKHERGVISMARTSVNDSASSQFFIMHKTNTDLDGNYAAFGKVISGMEIVDAIAAIATDSNDRPLDPPVINSATFVR